MAKSRSKEASEDTKLIVTVLVLLFAYPIGIILMWAWTSWKRWVKILITLPLILIPILAILLTAFLVAVNPTAQIEKAQRLSCQKQCGSGAGSTSCVSACVKNLNNPYRYISPSISPGQM